MTTNLKERFMEKFKTFLPDDGADRVAIDALPEDILTFIKQEFELLAESVNEWEHKDIYRPGDAAAIIKNRIQEL